jgi:hypothetical protein
VRRAAFLAALASALTVAAPAGGANALQMTASVTPRWLYFADPVTARIDVRFDPRRVVPASIRVDPTFAPWDEIAAARISTTAHGTIGHRTWWFTLACISIDCLPRGTAPQRFHLPKAMVTARARDGSQLVARRAWLPLKVAGRFAPAHTVGLRPVFQLDTRLPQATYRADPGLLALIFDVIGVALVAVALALGAAEASRWRATRRSAVDTTPPLLRAVALVREAKQRDVEDRRRAASLLARTLRREGNGLRSTATEVAWSPAEPTPVQLEDLAQSVEKHPRESA